MSAGDRDCPLPILYRDQRVVAVYKPAGLLVHRTRLDARERRFALQQVRDALGCHVYPVHRLDKPTAGVLLFALDPEAAGILSESFREGWVAKTYLGVVRGHVDGAGRVDHPLQRRVDRLAEPHACAGKPAQATLTEYERLATTELPHPVGRYATARYSLVRLFPRTGRKHQLRRHMAHLSHPLLGDTTYGDRQHNRFFRDSLGGDRLMLAAVALRFPLPASGEPIEVRATPDPGFRGLLAALGLPAG